MSVKSKQELIYFGTETSVAMKHHFCLILLCQLSYHHSALQALALADRERDLGILAILLQVFFVDNILHPYISFRKFQFLYMCFGWEVTVLKHL